MPNILIVDDVPANLKVLGDILEREGYKVRPVPSGKLALQVSAIAKPDLILLDIMMPGMDGFEVCRLLKENKNLSDVPVIFISALSDTSDIVNALNSGAVDYITKPFRAEEVIARVKTHLKLYHQNKELHELNATKDKFFSIIAHDLRSPFNNFLGLTQIMVEELPLLTITDLEEIALTLRDSAVNLFSLLGNLLEWARMQRGLTTFEPVLCKLMPEVSKILALAEQAAAKKGITVSYSIPDDLTVFADYNMLGGVMRNLVSNATKFTDKGGAITITAKPGSAGWVEICIQDSGIGMDKDMIANLFSLDKNTSRPGTVGEPSTGLGLIICKDFIEKHGGELRVESETGQGSTFRITLPADSSWEEKSKTAMTTAAEKPAGNSGKLKILIAEDDETSQLLLAIAVKKFSKETIKVYTGADAVTACHNNPDINLVLMDVKMPGMDGYEATRLIRQFNKEVVIIAQTAYSQIGDQEKAMESGCNDFISKPIEVDLLKERIDKYFVV